MTDARTANRWGQLAAAVFVVGLSLGTILSLGVFLAPIQGATGWSRTDISAVALLSWVTLGIGSFLWGVLSDRSGPRVVVGAGGLLLGLGLVLASQATALWQFMLAYGGLVGLAVGAFYAPLTSTVSKAFRANRGLALGLLSAGGGLGTVALAPLGRWLITEYGWRTAMLLLGDLAWLTMVPLALVIRDAPAEPAAPASAGAREPDLGLLQIGRTPQFWLIALTHFTCCVAHSGPIFHMVANATDHGVAQMAAATVFGVSSLASIGGRIASGLLADRLGSKPTLVALLSLQAPAILLYVVARETASFYALALVFGIAYGGVMPLYALLTRESFGARAMGGAYGAIYMLQAIGMGLGAFAGGWLYDRLGGYGWSFATAAAIGASAVLVALMLRAPRLALGRTVQAPA
ncbi:MAG: MFS transporter [Candidatus Rokubacteria bacterium]|nr:MFS transporter [Candidatus Rokubacteria bacterium]